MAVFDDAAPGASHAADDMHDVARAASASPATARSVEPALAARFAAAQAAGRRWRTARSSRWRATVFGDAVNVAARLLDHAGDNETLATATRRRALGDWERIALSQPRPDAAARPRRAGARAPAGGRRRFGDTAATAVRRHADAPAPSRRRIRLVWLDLNRIFAGTSLPVVLGRSPQATYIIDDTARLALARAHRLARRHLPADRPELQRHLRPLRQRRRDHQPAPRHLHAARQRRDRPRRAADRPAQPACASR